MELDGNLSQFPLGELIEMIVYSSVTGVLEVRLSSDVGQIFFRDGRPYHAAAAGHSGIEAVVAMFEVRQAPFRFVADTESQQETLWQDPLDMIEYAQEQARLWAAVRPRIPSMDLVPALRSAPPAGQIRISELAWQVLSVVDGRRSVREISEALNLVALDTCAALASLLDQGLVTIQQSRSGFLHPRSASPASAQGEHPEAGDGFLERLMTNLPADPSVPDEATQVKTRSDRYVANR